MVKKQKKKAIFPFLLQKFYAKSAQILAKSCIFVAKFM
ncbi:hypothetical protein HMPREF9296_2292 [Prevotella disiens FB035-09AN]|uniref:Uncharacterized protein n=1 Tax=Prevotella disiens FB035-09AN TaxID=866771 RepID=E1KR96_9BACT|nr:hypothetical protein HMPREF9296_2292 [Prevotella disiens FB035-09AN]